MRAVEIGGGLNLMRRGTFVLLGLCIAALLTDAAPAPTFDQLVTDCESEVPNKAMSACTAIINGGSSYSTYLFEAYRHRAAAEFTNRMDRAVIADITQALLINPLDEKLYTLRAQSYDGMNMPDAAIQDAIKAESLSPNDPFPYFLQGAEMGRQDQFAKDIAYQTKAISIDPNYFLSLNERSYAEGELGKYDASIVDASRAIILAPREISPYANKIASEYSDKETSLALKDIADAENLFPNHVYFFYLEGFMQGDLNNWQADLADQAKALTLDKDFLSAIVERLRAELLSGNDAGYDIALRDSTDIIKKYPDDPRAYLYHVVAENYLHQWVFAERDAKAVLAKFPYHLATYLTLGRAYVGEGAWPILDTSATTLMSLAKDDPYHLAYAYAERALVQRHNKEYQQSLINYGHAITIRPDIWGLYVDRSWVYIYMNKPDAALSDDNEAIHLDPTDDYAFRTRGDVYNQEHLYTMAEADDDRAIAIAPTASRVWNSRCWTRALSGNLKGALSDCLHASALSSSDANITDSTAFVYFRMHNYNTALKLYNDALAREPTLAGSYWGRALIEQQQGQSASATQDFKTAKFYNPAIAKEFAF